jgi:hypothetical protein
MSSISVDIYFEDIYREMDRYDKEEMAKWLAEDGILSSTTEITWPDPQNATEVELIQLLQDIWNNKNSLTNDDFNVLNRLGKKGLYE